MIRIHLSPSLRRALLYLVLCSAIVACDGGLFGTGDGDIVVPPESSPPATGVDTDIPSNPEPNEPMTPGMSPNGPDTISPVGVLENTLSNGDADALPRITLINNSTQALNIVTEPDSISLFDLPVVPGTASDPIELPDNQQSLLVTTGTELQRLISYSPINLAPDSTTTLIAYDQTPSDAVDSTRLGIIALPTMTGSRDATVATLRIVQSVTLDESDTPATLSLVPAGSNPGSGEVDFNNVSLATALMSTYQSVNAGTYLLQDSLARIAPIPLTISADTVYTLVISRVADPVLTVLIDSDTSR